GSNLEDAIAKLTAHQPPDDPNKPDEHASRPTTISLKVVEGTVLSDDAAAGGHWRLHDVNVQFDSSRAAAATGQLSLSGQLEDGDVQQAASDLGRFAITLAPAQEAAGRR